MRTSSLWSSMASLATSTHAIMPLYTVTSGSAWKPLIRRIRLQASRHRLCSGLTPIRFSRICKALLSIYKGINDGKFWVQTQEERQHRSRRGNATWVASFESDAEEDLVLASFISRDEFDKFKDKKLW